MLSNVPLPTNEPCCFSKPVDKTAAYKEGPWVIYDPWCDPLKPKTIYYDDVLKAHKVIKENIEATPMTISTGRTAFDELKNNKAPGDDVISTELLRAGGIQQWNWLASFFNAIIHQGLTPQAWSKAKASVDFGMNLYYKREIVHRTGSFHERAAIYALHSLTKMQSENGIFTASLGNWAKALAYHAQKLHIPVTAHIPATGQKNCRAYCEYYGATVIEAGDTMTESRKLAIEKMIKSTGEFDCYINGYDHPHVIAAAGTIAIEILEQLPEVEAILVPIGGGGLIAGIAAVIKNINPRVLIYGIEPYKSCCFYKALVNEKPYSIQNERTMPIAGCNAFHTARSLIDKMILVDDDCIARSVLHFMEEERFIVEPISATALACLFVEPNIVPELQNKNVVCVVTGGSIDMMTFPRALNRGKFAEGRMISMKIALPLGRTDECERALIIIFRLGCHIIYHDMEHEWINAEDIGHTYLVLQCETRGLSHAASVKRVMEKLYPDKVQFLDDEYCNPVPCQCSPDISSMIRFCLNET